jgi:hypothetical protein
MFIFISGRFVEVRVVPSAAWKEPVGKMMPSKAAPERRKNESVKQLLEDWECDTRHQHSKMNSFGS